MRDLGASGWRRRGSCSPLREGGALLPSVLDRAFKVNYEKNLESFSKVNTIALEAY
jgi:hypothetical protein